MEILSQLAQQARVLCSIKENQNGNTNIILTAFDGDLDASR